MFDSPLNCCRASAAYRHTVIPKDKNPRLYFSGFYLCNDLVGPAKENSNYIFGCLESLCEQLDELDIEDMMIA